MLAILGLITGIVATGAWISAERTEQNQRKNSKDNNREFYFDKNGRMRHTGSGRKYTPAEIHQSFFPESLEEKSKRHEQMMYEEWGKKYYAVYNPYKSDKNNALTGHFYEVFESEEEAEKYLNDNIDAFADAPCTIRREVIPISIGQMATHNKSGNEKWVWNRTGKEVKYIYDR